MENSINLDALLEKTGDYLEDRVELLRLQALDKSSEVVSTMTSKIVVVLLVIFFLAFLNIGLALLIGEALGKMYYGFFIVAGFYLLMGVLFYAFRHQLIKGPVDNYIIRKFSN